MASDLWPGTGAVFAFLYGLQPHNSVGSVWKRHYRLQISYSTPGLTGPLYSVQGDICPATEKVYKYSETDMMKREERKTGDLRGRGKGGTKRSSILKIKRNIRSLL